MSDGWTLLGVPIDSVGRAGGTEHGPRKLRELRIGELCAHDAGDLDVGIRGDERDPSTGILGSPDVLATTVAIREAVGSVIGDGGHPLLAGGDCSELPGALAGARDVLGNVGVAYLDGHLDLYDGITSPTGEAADMPLSVAFGFGPAAWVDACGRASVRPEDAIPIGFREVEELPLLDELAPRLGGGFHPASLEDVRDEGPATAGARIAGELEAGAGRYWLHLDVDILDESVFPATDYLMPGGMGWDELLSVMRPLAKSPALVGVSIGCYNPEKDPGDACGQALVEAWRDVLG